MITAPIQVSVAIENASAAALEAAIAIASLDPSRQSILTGAARRLREALLSATAAAHLLELAFADLDEMNEDEQ